MIAERPANLAIRKHRTAGILGGTSLFWVVDEFLQTDDVEEVIRSKMLVVKMFLGVTKLSIEFNPKCLGLAPANNAGTPCAADKGEIDLVAFKRRKPGRYSAFGTGAADIDRLNKRRIWAELQPCQLIGIVARMLSPIGAAFQIFSYRCHYCKNFFHHGQLLHLHKLGSNIFYKLN